MPVSTLLRPGRGTNPLSFFAAVVVVAAFSWVLRGRAPVDGATLCDPFEDPACDVQAERASPSVDVASREAEGPVLKAADACLGVGYLCAELNERDRFRVERWTGFTGPIVVHVPRPDFEDAADARRLQSAAAAGIRAWNGQPFDISIDERGHRDPHFEVRWTPSLGGTQIGVARTQWSPSTGRRVLALELTTRSPFRPTRVIDPSQIRLTAAHEMGHALGLPHSDQRRDVMYPTNSATSLSARDYRTMEALYALEDGTVIVR